MKIYRSGSFWKNSEGAIGQYIYIPVYKSREHKFEANNGNCKAKMVFYMWMVLDTSGSFWKNLGGKWPVYISLSIKYY